MTTEGALRTGRDRSASIVVDGGVTAKTGLPDMLRFAEGR
jgi:hypothetical protein